MVKKYIYIYIYNIKISVILDISSKNNPTNLMTSIVLGKKLLFLQNKN